VAKRHLNCTKQRLYTTGFRDELPVSRGGSHFRRRSNQPDIALIGGNDPRVLPVDDRVARRGVPMQMLVHCRR